MPESERRLTESDLPPKRLMDAVRNFETEREKLVGSYSRLNPGEPLGVTCAISESMPDKNDFEVDEALKKAMPVDVYENDIDICSRLQVLSMLNEMALSWVKSCGATKKLPTDVIETLHCHIRTFGSFRLGVHNKGGDIDTLLVAPKFIERKDFFTSFVVCLKQCPYIHDVIVIEDAFVPIIKFQYDDIEIDMLFARVNMVNCHDRISLLEDDILKNLDIKCVRSLNGCRVTDEILRLVPNSNVFRSALRVIKHWAKNRGVYSNSLGFMGGVTWAMMVARVCQLYPNALAATIVRKFFFVYYKWAWPEPVILKPMGRTFISGMPQWNPLENVADAHHLMPVITPANPQQNSTHNISRSAKAILLGEFERGMKVCEDIFQKKCSWKALSAPYCFFKRYNHYIMISAVSKTKTRCLEWQSYVESRLRHLVLNLEKNRALKFAHVFCKRLEPRKKEENLYICNWFVGIAIHDFVVEGVKKSASIKNTTPRANLDLSKEIYWFQQTINNKNALSRNFNRAEHYMRLNPIARSQIAKYITDKDMDVKVIQPYYKMAPVFKQPTTMEQIRSRKRSNQDLEKFKQGFQVQKIVTEPLSKAGNVDPQTDKAKDENEQKIPDTSALNGLKPDNEKDETDKPTNSSEKVIESSITGFTNLGLAGSNSVEDKKSAEDFIISDCQSTECCQTSLKDVESGVNISTNRVKNGKTQVE